MTDVLTEDEQKTVQTAAIGAVALVTSVVPGFFGDMKEIVVGSKVLAGAGGTLAEILRKGRPKLEGKSSADLEAQVLPALTASVGILEAKLPGEVAAYRTLVTTAAEKTAETSKGTAPQEAEAVSKIKAALGAA